MAKKIVEVASFDIETDKAVQSINKYINSLKKLEDQRKDNIRLGKSTVAVNKKIDKSIDEINKSLKQETSTLKGNVAQLESVRKVQKDISRGSQKRIGLLDKEVKKRKAISKSLNSQRKSFSNLKFLAVGAAASIVAGFGQVGESIDAVNNVLFPHIGLQNKVAEATKSAAFEYVQEKASLDNLFEASRNDNLSKEEKREAIDLINEKYGEYLPKLLDENTSLVENAKAQKIATAAVLARAAAQIKVSIAQKLIQEAIDGQIDATTKQAQKGQGITDKIATGFTKLGNLIPTVFIGRKLGLVPTLNDVADKVTDVGTELDNIKTKSAIEQLQILGKTGSGVFEGFLKQFDGLSGLFGDIDKVTKDTGTSTGKTKKQVKDLSGTIAGLNKQLAEAKKFLQEDIQRTDFLGLENQQKTITNIEKQIKDLQDFLKGLDAEPIEFGELEFFEPDLDTLFTLDKDKVTESLQKGLDLLNISDLKAKVEQVELKGLIDVEALEDARNEALKFFRGTEEERDALNQQFSNRRLARERQTAIEIVQLQLKILQAERLIAETAGESLDVFDKAIAELNLKLTELERQEVDIKVNAETGEAESKIAKVKETIGFVTQGIEELGGAIIQFFQQQTDAAITKLEGDIARQQSFLEELLGNQEGANAQQVELERERLDNLVAEREKAVERQAAIAQLEIALNAAIAIARAAAEGGAGAAITIAATLISLAIGFAQAKATASQAFVAGSDYVTRGKGEPSGTDTINARLNEGEAVIQTDKNKRYHSAVKAIRRGSVDAGLMNDFVTNPAKYREFASSSMHPSLQGKMDASGVVLNAPMAGLGKKDIEEMVSEMREMRKMMGQITVSEWQVKGKQFAKVVTSVQDNKNRNKKRFK